MIDAVSLAQALIRCPSVTPADAGALDVLERALRPLGFSCRRMRFHAEGTAAIDNLYAKFATGDGRHFCFAGHSDVVPPGQADLWRHDAFSGTIEDGWLIGRGAADMKGAIAAFAAGAERFLSRRADRFRGAISLLITGDEEGPSINGTKPMLEALAQAGEKFDACIVGEPTNPRRLGEMAKIGRRGSLSGRLTVKGIQGHVAYPHLADNPLHRLARMMSALCERPLDLGNRFFQPTSLQFTTIDTGNPATNLIPAQARASFNVRFNDNFTRETLEREIRARLAAIGGDFELAIECSGEAFLTQPGELCQILADAVAAKTAIAPEFTTTGGTSDARFIKDYCPVVEFGLVGETMHKIDERASIADVEMLSQIYEAVLERFFDAEPR
jgi:succinyl-diaminopimelate desuccinylase